MNNFLKRALPIFYFLLQFFKISVNFLLYIFTEHKQDGLEIKISGNILFIKTRGVKMESFTTDLIRHDFNNLMTVISGNIFLALSGLPKDSPQRKFISNIKNATLSTKSLVDQYFLKSTDQSFMNSEANIENNETNLNSFLISKIDLLRSVAGKDFEVNLHIGNIPKNLKISEIQLERIMVNLVTNAREANNKKRGKIDIKITPNDGYVIIEVSDNGRGIKKDDLEKVFEFLYSTKKTSSSEKRGMGLAIVSRLVSRCNGSIDVKSQENEGTVFTIQLPLV